MSNSGSNSCAATTSATSVVPVAALTVGIFGVGVLLYRLSVKWNTNQMAKCEAKVTEDSVALLASLQQYTPQLPDNKNDSEANQPFSPIVMGDQTRVCFKNRIIKAAVYEALCDNNGVPLPELAEFHVKMTEGGCGMSIVAYAGTSLNCSFICVLFFLHFGERTVNNDVLCVYLDTICLQLSV
jgi:hypothetical protein